MPSRHKKRHKRGVNYAAGGCGRTPYPTRHKAQTALDNLAAQGVAPAAAEVAPCARGGHYHINGL